MRHIARYIVIVTLIIVWSMVSIYSNISELIIPSPVSVIRSFWAMLNSELFYLDLGASVFRILISLLISCLIGIPIGLFMGFNLSVYRSFIFLVDFFRSIPPIALFPVFILVLGLGEMSKIAVPFYGCTFVIIVSSIYGVLYAPEIRRNVAKMSGFSNWQIFCNVVIPDALPFIISGARTALSLAVVLTIVVEMLLGADFGIGKRIYDTYLVFQIPEMFVMIFVTGVLGYLFNQLFIYFEKRFFHWKNT